MLDVKLNLEYSGIVQKTLMEYKDEVENIHKDLHRRSSDEDDFVRMVRTSNKL